MKEDELKQNKLQLDTNNRRHYEQLAQQKEQQEKIKDEQICKIQKEF